MDILLTHGYFIEEDAGEQKIMKPYPPLGILYISAFLDTQNLENEVFDTTFSSKKTFFEFLLKNKPNYIGIYTNLVTKINVIEIIAFVKNEISLKNTKIIVGGPDTRYNAENLLKYNADFVVVGEGETTFFELISLLKTQENNTNAYQNEDFSQKLNEIQGIAFLENEKVILTAERPKIKEIDLLPFPNRHKISFDNYLNKWKEFHGYSAMTISTMRGCPYTCKWCSRAVYGVSYRRRSAKNVVEELKQILQKYQPDMFWFVDDVFTVSFKWLEEFVKELDNQNVTIKYECITRADRMNENVIDLLKKSGCFRVWIGAESGSQKVIDLMDRRVQVTQVRDMIQLAQKQGIQAGTFIMLGYPNETETDILETVEHLKSSNPDLFTITIAYPIKGTELYEEVEAKSNVTTLDWAQSTDRQIDFTRTYTRSYYAHAVKYVQNEVYFHQLLQKKGHFSKRGLKLKIRSIYHRWQMHLKK